MLNRMLVVATVMTALIAATDSLEAQKPKPDRGGNTLFPVTAELRCPMTADCIGDGIEGDSVGSDRGNE